MSNSIAVLSPMLGQIQKLKLYQLCKNNNYHLALVVTHTTYSTHPSSSYALAVKVLGVMVDPLG
jgi:hypothetical protein